MNGADLCLERWQQTGQGPCNLQTCVSHCWCQGRALLCSPGHGRDAAPGQSPPAAPGARKRSTPSASLCHNPGKSFGTSWLLAAKFDCRSQRYLLFAPHFVPAGASSVCSPTSLPSLKGRSSIRHWRTWKLWEELLRSRLCWQFSHGRSCDLVLNL